MCTCRDQKRRQLNPLELELQEVINCSMWLLASKLLLSSTQLLSISPFLKSFKKDFECCCFLLVTVSVTSLVVIIKYLAEATKEKRGFLGSQFWRDFSPSHRKVYGQKCGASDHTVSTVLTWKKGTQVLSTLSPFNSIRNQNHGWAISLMSVKTLEKHLHRHTRDVFSTWVYWTL